MNQSSPNFGIIVVPALIALGVTLVRLVGELGGGPALLFNANAGGGGALIGIVWLVPVFGAYFAAKLVRGGHPPMSAGRVIGFSLLSLLIGAAIMALSVFFTGDPNSSVSLFGAVFQQLGFGVAALVAVLILSRAWPPYFKILLGYAFASRLPVAIVMFLAMMGEWGTHYELGPPGYPETGFLTQFFLIALMPQMTFWIMFTMVVGTLFGGVTVALMGSQRGD